MKRLWKFRQEKKARVVEMMRCGNTYTLHELGDGTKFVQKYVATTRAKCLTQVYLRSPQLPLTLETVWESHKWAFAKRCSGVWKERTGTMFLNKMIMLIAELGTHYEGHEAVKAKLRPQDLEFLKENKKLNDRRAFEHFVLGLSVWLPVSMRNLPTG